MICLVTIILLGLSPLLRSNQLQTALPRLQATASAVAPINVSDLPVRITAITAEVSRGETWFRYSINNTSPEDVSRVDFRVFITDSNGSLISMDESTNSDRIAAGATQKGQAFIKTTTGENTLTLVAVTKVVTDSGVWQVDKSSLESAIRRGYNCQAGCKVGTTFEPNIIVTDSDRAQIFELILRDLLDDQRKTAKLQQHSQLNLLRSSVNFPLPKIAGRTLVALSESEIQEIADQEKRVVFLNYEPLRVEGSRVLATIAVRDAVSKHRGAFVQYKYAFRFTCLREKDQWIIEKSMGYAQS